jgi:hypothetical protein
MGPRPTHALWTLVLGACLLAALPAADAEQLVFKCGSRRGTTYSDVPCRGSTLQSAPHRETPRTTAQPQDRAKAMNRAQLAPKKREECERLDVQLREDKAAFASSGEASAENTLVRTRLRYNDLHC